MTPAFVMDCSVAMSWLFAEERTDATVAIQNRLVTESAVVPALWYLEVANVLAIAERKQRITSTDAEQFARLLCALEIATDPGVGSASFDTLLPLCRTHRLTAYDAAYLELALRRQLPLATLDRDLRVAAAVLGVVTLGQA